jgi:hypothetical protein
LRVAEAKRSLTFEYCLLASGSSHNRAPSEQRWEKGDVLSLDSGGITAISATSPAWPCWASRILS